MAEQGYRRVVELNPLPPQPHWMHARMLLYLGRVREAEQEMREVVSKNPDQYKALAYFGSMLYYEGKFVKKDVPMARTLLEKACKLGSDAACKNVELLTNAKP